MSLEAAVRDIVKGSSAVRALVGGSTNPRIYPLGIPPGKAMPAVIYQQISSFDIVTTDNQTGLRTDRVSVASWDDDPDGARTLAEAVRTAMAAATGSHGSVTIQYCVLIDERDLYEVDEQSDQLTRYGKLQDWEIAYKP